MADRVLLKMLVVVYLEEKVTFSWEETYYLKV